MNYLNLIIEKWVRKYPYLWIWFTIDGEVFDYKSCNTLDLFKGG